MTTHSKPKKTKRRRRLALGLALGLVGAGAGLYAWAQTAAGQARLERYLEKRLSVGAYQVALEGFGGRLPWAPRVERITVADASGVWLTFEGVRLEWRARSLWKREVHGVEAVADRITVRRRPLPTRARDTGMHLPAEGGRIPRVRIDRFAVEALRLEAPVLGRAVAVRIEGTVRPGPQALHLRATATERAEAPMHLDLTWRAGPTVTLRLAAEPLHFAGRSVSQFLLDASAAWADARLRGATRLSVRRGDQTARLAFRYAMDADGVRFDEAVLEAVGATVRGAAEWPFARPAPVGAFTLEVPDLSVPVGLFGLEVAGALRASLDLSLEEDVPVARLAWTGAEWRYRDGSGEALRGEIQCRDWRRPLPAWRVALEGQGVAVPNVALDVLRLQAEGRARAMTFSAAAKGRAGAAAPAFEGECRGRLNAGDQRQELVLDDGAFQFGSVKTSLRAPAMIRRDGGLPFPGPGASEPPSADLWAWILGPCEQDGEATAETASVWMAPCTLALGEGVLELSGRWRPGFLDATGSVRRLSIKAFDASAAGRWTGFVEGEAVLDGAMADPVLRVSARATELRPREATMDTPPWDIDLTAAYGAGATTAEFRAQADESETVEGTLKWPLRFSLSPPTLEVPPSESGQAALRAQVDLAASSWWARYAPPALTNVVGRMDAALTLEGSRAQPKATLHIEADALRGPWFGGSAFPDGAISVTATCFTNRVHATASARVGQLGSAELVLDLPAQYSLFPPMFTLPDEADQRAVFRHELDLAEVSRLPMMQGMEFGGRVAIDLQYEGTRQQGRAMGTGRLEKGFYEHYLLGTAIRDVDVHMEADRNGEMRLKATATDGGPGRFDAEGVVEVSPSAGFPFHAALNLQKTRLVRRGDAEATASGVLRAKGSAGQVTVEGRLTIDPAYVYTDNLLPPPPASLLPPPPEAEVKTPEARAPTASQGPAWLQLTIDLETPGALFVKGRASDSAWGGAVQIRRREGLWALSGILEPRRGSYSFLSRPFRFTGGQIRFDGAFPPMPFLDITAVYERKDLTAYVQILGRLSDPEIKLTSDPVMPEDEVLARVLFGKNLASISALQAVQMAAAARRLRQPAGGGQDWLGRFTRAFGIDQLDLRESAGAESTQEIVAGKYLQGGVYVEINVPVQSNEGATLRTEYEILPNLTVESTTGNTLRPGMGLNWKKDY